MKRSLEELVFELKGENKRIKEENEGLLMKNKLLLQLNESMRDDSSKPSMKSSSSKDYQQEAETKSNSVSSKVYEDLLYKYNRSQESLSQKESMLAEVSLRCEKLEADLRDCEEEKQEICQEMEQAAEREVFLEERVKELEQTVDDLEKETGDWKGKIKEIFGEELSARKIKDRLDRVEEERQDIEFQLRELQEKEAELGDTQKDLERKLRFMEERNEALDSRESNLREQERELAERMKRAETDGRQNKGAGGRIGDGRQSTAVARDEIEESDDLLPSYYSNRHEKLRQEREQGNEAAITFKKEDNLASQFKPTKEMAGTNESLSGSRAKRSNHFEKAKQEAQRRREQESNQKESGPVRDRGSRYDSRQEEEQDFEEMESSYEQEELDDDEMHEVSQFEERSSKVKVLADKEGQ